MKKQPHSYFLKKKKILFPKPPHFLTSHLGGVGGVAQENYYLATYYQTRINNY